MKVLLYVFNTLVIMGCWVWAYQGLVVGNFPDKQPIFIGLFFLCYGIEVLVTTYKECIKS